MDQVGLPDDTSSQKTSRRKAWILFFLLALLFHVLLFSIRLALPPPSARPAPVEVQKMDPSQLNAIRQKWQRNPIVLNRDDALPHEKTAPEKARYDSDRNSSVAREQKSIYVDSLPVPGAVGPAPAMPGATAKRPPAAKPSTARELPSIGNLGIAFHIQDHPIDPPRRDPNEKPMPTETYGSGKDQALLDDTLSTGAETMLNTRESHFYAFFKRIQELMAPLLTSNFRTALSRNQREIQAGRYISNYEVILDQEGNLLEIKFAKRFGIEDLDHAIEISWQKIGKFHNPPRGLIEDDQRVHLRFTSWFDISDDRSVNQFDYPRRTF